MRPSWTSTIILGILLIIVGSLVTFLENLLGISNRPEFVKEALTRQGYSDVVPLGRTYGISVKPISLRSDCGRNPGRHFFARDPKGVPMKGVACCIVKAKGCLVIPEDL